MKNTAKNVNLTQKYNKIKINISGRMEKVDLKLVTNACDMQDFITWVATLHSSNPSCDVRP